jgi:large subunit ribosomal protein L5
MNLKQYFQKEVAPGLKKDLGKDNLSAVPTVEKIVVNMGVGRALNDRKFLDSAAADLAVITGQKPSFRAARKDEAGFSVRAGKIIGLSVTLRGARMWDFLAKLIHVVIPRLRDFRGLSRKSFDGHGNYSLGIAEQTAFPEIDPNKLDTVKSLEVTIVTTAKTDEEGLALLKALGMPFKRTDG